MKKPEKPEPKEKITCPGCKGEKKVQVVLYYEGNKSRPATLECDMCEGTGLWEDDGIPMAR